MEGGVVWRCKTKYAYGQSVNALPLGISLTCGTGVWANRSQLTAKWPTRRSLRETRCDNTQTGSHGGQDIFKHGWLIDIIHYMLGCHFPPFSGINVYFIRDKKRVQTLHHAVLVVVLLVLLRLALRLFVKSNNDGTPHVGYYSVCLWQSDTEWTDACPPRVGCISQKA